MESESRGFGIREGVGRKKGLLTGERTGDHGD